MVPTALPTPAALAPGPARPRRRRRVLPGFKLTLGYTVFYLLLVVLIPLSATFLQTAKMSPAEFWETVTNPRVMASYRLSFGAAFAAAGINAVLGLMVAWTLVRYPFPGRRVVDAMIDLPFALPTAVAGIALCTLYSRTGWLGTLGDTLWDLRGVQLLAGGVAWVVDALLGGLSRLGLGTYQPTDPSSLVTWLNLDFAYSRAGVVVALMFVSLPFIVRTVQPVLEDLSKEVEEASLSLGATRFQTFWRVILPEVWPALLTGFALAFARAVGEYGSVVFISGNRPMRTEIAPLMIYTKLEQYDYAGATAIAVVMLVVSFSLLLLINALQRWSGSGRSG